MTLSCSPGAREMEARGSEVMPTLRDKVSLRPDWATLDSQEGNKNVGSSP